MQTRWLRWVLAALAALILLPAAVQAQQVNPFRGGPGLSQEDNRLLFESVARLNAAEPAHAGLSEAWSKLRVFHSGGMVCHLVQHRIAVPRRPPPVSYRLTWCRTSNGEWKIKS